MKKKYLSAALIAAMAFTACACGTKAPAGDETAPADTISVTDENMGIAIEDEDFEGFEIPESEFTFEKTDDKNAVLTEVVEYSTGYSSQYVYTGTYEKDGDNYLFTYGTPEAETTMELIMDGDNVIDTTLIDLSIADYVGTFTCDDPDMGKLELTIHKDGSAQLMIEDLELQGNVYYDYDADKLELMAYNDESMPLARDEYAYAEEMDLMDEEVMGDEAISAEASVEESEDAYDYIDWYITIDGDTFTHEPYASSYFADLEGTYTCEGDLGTLVINVSADGTATTTAEINDKKIDFTGSCYSDFGATDSFGVYVYSDDNSYTLDLTIDQLSDGTMNYSGYLTTPLSAG